MPRLGCCVSTCKDAPKDPSVLLIAFPKDPVLTEQWRIVCGLPPDFVIKPLTRICSKHFRSGKRSLSPDSEDYIPSVFEVPRQAAKRSYCKTCRKVTLNCPCKVAWEEGPTDQESGDEDNGEVEEKSEGEEGDNGQDDAEEEQEEEEEPEEGLDDGQVVDSDDDDWIPAVETAKPRRSSRSRRKRRHPSSESSASDDEESEAPPPAKAVKKSTPAKPRASPAKKVTKSPVKKATDSPVATESKEVEGSAEEKGGDDNGATTPTVKATPKQRRRRTKKEISATPGVNGTPAEADGETPGASDNSTPNNTNSKKITAVPIPTPPVPRDAYFMGKIKEMDIEHSMKLEKLLKTHNLRVANLKEEHLQSVHRMKVEWELERANLQSQIEYYKETLHQRTLDEQPMNPFNGGQPIIVLQAPDHDEGIDNNDRVFGDED